MDNTFLHFETLANMLSNNPLPAIPYVDYSCSGSFYNPPAQHIEITYITHGGYNDLMIGDKRVSLAAGQISLHNVHFGNYSSFSQNTRGWCVFLEAGDLPLTKEWTDAPFVRIINISNPERLMLAFKTLAEKCRIPGWQHPGYLSGTKAYDPKNPTHNTLGRTLHIKSALLELMATIIQDCLLSNEMEHKDNLQIIDLALEFMAINFNKPDITLETIAEKVDLSPDYFGMLFKRHIGTSPINYLRKVRIEQAKVLLINTQLPIKEIAKKVGYDDPLYFSRVFRNVTGQSPRQWKSHT